MIPDRDLVLQYIALKSRYVCVPNQTGRFDMAWLHLWPFGVMTYYASVRLTDDDISITTGGVNDTERLAYFSDIRDPNCIEGAIQYLKSIKGRPIYLWSKDVTGKRRWTPFMLVASYCAITFFWWWNWSCVRFFGADKSFTRLAR